MIGRNTDRSMKLPAGKRSGIRRMLLAGAGVTVLCACGSRTSPEMLFTQWESRLLNAERIEIPCRIVSSGVIESSLEGNLTLEKGNRADLHFTGVFRGDSVHLTFHSDGKILSGRYGKQIFDRPAPSRLSEAFIIGFTRMGLLHNVAILNSGVPPDRSEGSVREWITTDNYTLLPLGERETGIGFQMRIEERIVGRATLVFDRETGLAVRRDQTVLFSNGKMEVKEYYPSIRIFPTDSLNTQQLPAQ